MFSEATTRVIAFYTQLSIILKSSGLRFYKYMDNQKERRREYRWVDHSTTHLPAHLSWCRWVHAHHTFEPKSCVCLIMLPALPEAWRLNWADWAAAAC